SKAKKKQENIQKIENVSMISSTLELQQQITKLKNEHCFPPLKKRLKVDDSNGNKYCICKSYEGNDMVSCDGKCQDWYHIKCVGVSQAEFKEIVNTNKIWYCPLCTFSG